MTYILEDERLEILRAAAADRRKGFTNYQINIDNFRLAIEKVEKEHADKPHMVDFAEHLKSLLQSSLAEQDKERVMLEVIEQQLEGK
jgi:hypothetical protein